MALWVELGMYPLEGALLARAGFKPIKVHRQSKSSVAQLVYVGCDKEAYLEGQNEHDNQIVFNFFFNFVTTSVSFKTYV